MYCEWIVNIVNKVKAKDKKELPPHSWIQTNMHDFPPITSLNQGIFSLCISNAISYEVNLNFGYTLADIVN